MQDVDDTASGPGNQPEADAAPDAPQTEEAQDGAQERTPDAAASTAGRTDPAQEQDTADTAAPPQDDAPAHDAQDAHAEQGEQGEHEATPEEDPFGSHLLDQSEIDNLLGHTFGGFEEPEETGMERV
ncbi:MAG: hypothetical protein ABF641_10770, partial [Acetobacter sp.]